MNPIEIQAKQIKGFEIRNFVGHFTEITLQIHDVDGSIQKALANISFHNKNYNTKIKSPKEKVSDAKRILQKSFNA